MTIMEISKLFGGGITMILITNNLNYCLALGAKPQYRLILVSEESVPAYLKAGTVSLPILLPPSELMAELMNDLEHFNYDQAINAFLCQYQDYLNSNTELEDIIHMITLSALNNEIVIYVSENDMNNDQFPFFGTMLQYLATEFYGQTIQFDRNTYGINLTQYSAINSALYLRSRSAIELDVVLAILNRPETELPPDTEYKLLAQAYGNQFHESPEMQHYLSKQVLKDILLGKQIIRRKKPAFLWGV